MTYNLKVILPANILTLQYDVTVTYAGFIVLRLVHNKIQRLWKLRICAISQRVWYMPFKLYILPNT